MPSPARTCLAAARRAALPPERGAALVEHAPGALAARTIARVFDPPLNRYPLKGGGEWHKSRAPR